jgi:hypothetical protein
VLAYFIPPMIRGITVPHPSAWFYEMALQWLPFWDYAGAMLKQGLIPAWTPHIYCGWPFSSYPPTNFYYPPFYLLMHLNYVHSIYLENIISFMVSGIFLYLTFRKFGLVPLASLAGMLSFVGGSYFTVYTTYAICTRALFLYILATWAAVSLAKDRLRFRYWAVLVVSLALGFTVDVEQQIYILFFLVGLVWFASSKGQRIKRTFILGIGIIAAFLLALWPLINLAGYMPFSLRSQGITFSYYAPPGMKHSAILALFFPAHQVFHTLVLPAYLGWSVIWLMVEGIRHLKRASIPAILAVLIYGMFVSNLQPIMWVTYHLPVLGQLLLHYTSIIVIFAILAGLAAFGAESLFNRFRLSGPKILLPSLLALIIVPIAAYTKDWSRASLLAIIGLCGLFLIPRFSSIRQKRLAILWVFIFLGVDLLLLTFRDRPRTPYHKFDIHPVAKEFLQMHIRERFWVLSPLMDEHNLADTELHPLMGMRLDPLIPGTHSPLGYWRVPPMRIARLINKICPGYITFDEQGRLDDYKPELVFQKQSVNESTLPLLSLMNVGIIFSRGIELERVEGLSFGKANDLIIYKNSRALPRAFIVSRIIRAENPKRALELVSSGKIDFKKQVVVEEEFPFAPKEFPRPEFRTRLDVIEARPGYWEFEINSPGYLSDLSLPQYFLFVSETRLPGWRAELAGKETRVYYANYAFMGVPIRAGHYTLKLFYKPKHFQIGMWATISGAIFWLFIPALLLSLKKGRKGLRGTNQVFKS